MGKILNLLILSVLIGCSIRVGYEAFFEQFLILTTEKQIFVTIFYATIYGCVYVVSRLVIRDHWVKRILRQPKAFHSLIPHDTNLINPLKIICALSLMAGIWIEGIPRYIDAQNWDQAPGPLMLCLIGCFLISGAFWILFSGIIYFISFLFATKMQFQSIMRLTAYTFIHLFILFLLLNATLIFPHVGFNLINAITAQLNTDIFGLAQIIILFQVTWSIGLCVWILKSNTSST